MSNYFEFNDKITFHPGYYLKEIVEESGLTQEDFAKRLGTTPKNLSKLINGEQRVSIDMAMKLSRLLGTSTDYWLNLQKSYDSLLAEYDSFEELKNERKIFKNLDYGFFRKHFSLPDLARKVDEQIVTVRNFLNVSSLSVLAKRDMYVNFRSSSTDITEANTIKANAMVQIAINLALKIDAPRFDKKIFERAVDYSLTLTQDHSDFFPKLSESFRNAGVIFIILPNMPGSKINGATKKLGDNIVLMVNNRRLYSDSFWFTLMHEIGHIMNGDYGISFDEEKGEIEEAADAFAQSRLIPGDLYNEFVEKNLFTVASVREFAESIDRDPGIVLGRLQHDELVPYTDRRLQSLRKKYRIHINN